MSEGSENQKACKNCKSLQVSNYCQECGQIVYTKRFTVKSFFVVFLDAFNIQKGFLFTARMLFTKPGILIDDYISGKTRLYYNPLKFLFIIAAVYAFLIIWLDIFDTAIDTFNFVEQETAEGQQMQERWMKEFQQYINFIPFLLIPFTSLISNWFYKSRKRLYGEHLIINCYLFAQSFIIIILLVPIIVLIPALMNLFPLLCALATIIYLTLALRNIFKQSVVKAFFSALGVYLIGFLLFMLFFAISLFIVFVVIGLFK